MRGSSSISSLNFLRCFSRRYLYLWKISGDMKRKHAHKRAGDLCFIEYYREITTTKRRQCAYCILPSLSFSYCVIVASHFVWLCILPCVIQCFSKQFQSSWAHKSWSRLFSYSLSSHIKQNNLFNVVDFECMCIMLDVVFINLWIIDADRIHFFRNLYYTDTHLHKYTHVILINSGSRFLV